MLLSLLGATFARQLDRWWMSPLRGKMMARWCFQTFLFSPLLGEVNQFDSYFSKGLKPPTRWGFHEKKESHRPYEKFQDIFFAVQGGYFFFGKHHIFEN